MGNAPRKGKYSRWDMTRGTELDRAREESNVGVQQLQSRKKQKTKEKKRDCCLCCSISLSLMVFFFGCAVTLTLVFSVTSSRAVS